MAIVTTYLHDETIDNKTSYSLLRISEVTNVILLEASVVYLIPKTFGGWGNKMSSCDLSIMSLFEEKP